ncbi:phosphatidate cytidylyltransferase [Mycoplasmopsis bovirhinis]|uniref:Phosphatidate cytidylyltransferase n=1 Tax=Mycoplasmopsis bovirhinis TaxID=29553 RepID=A0A449AER6_9BACT|nr:phosphatidate cytidylyltransferase [Mycoplasmopsis bovirhinis]VEU63472.1 Phosphatidate cytidylyltransferase [Mycoplasmopsis bovirhinis]
MNIVQKNKNTLLKNRVVPGILMLIALAALLALHRFSFYHSINYGKEVVNALYVISSITIALIGFWVWYELSYTFLQNKKAAIIQAIIMTLAIPYWRSLYTAVNFEDRGETNPWIHVYFTAKMVIQDMAFDWWTGVFLILPILSFPIIRLILLLKEKNQILYKNFFINYLLYFITYLIILAMFKTYAALNAMRDGLYFIILCFSIAVAHDIGGFFGGMTFGHKLFKRKLAPAISPKKTIEGAIVGISAGILVIILFSVIYYYGFKANDQENLHINTDFISGIVHSLKIPGYYSRIIGITNFTILAPFFALTGDLYFSYLKRRMGIKDFSNILKGHGGILDRLDSIAFVFTLFFILSTVI